MSRSYPRLLAFFGLLVGVAAAHGGVTRGALRHGGLQRSYTVFQPENAPAGPRPLLIVLHGSGQTGSRIMRQLGTNTLAERDGFVVVYPDGVGNVWNDGRGVDQQGNTGVTQIDDVGFVSALIDRGLRRWGADRGRVYVAGVSNGALMTYRLGIELGDRLAGAAAVVGTLAEPLATATPQAAVPMLIMNGTADQFVPYGGGTSPKYGPRAGRVLSTQATVDFWARANGGQLRAVTEELPDVTRRDGSRVERTVVTTGSGKPVELYSVIGGGHTIPGPLTGPELRFLFGRKNQDVDGVAVIWSFLASQGTGAQAQPAVPPARTPTAARGLQTGSLVQGGRRRTYSYHLPNGVLPSTPSPVLFVLHGGAPGIGKDIARATGYDAIADREGCVVIYPDGVDGQWNDGRGVSLRPGVDVTQFDDVGFVRALVNRVVPTLGGDPRRLYLVGISNGGMLAHRVGIELGDRFAAIAAVICNLPRPLSTQQPVAPLPVLLLNGTADEWAPFAGGQALAKGNPVGELLSTQASAAFWVRNNHGRRSVRSERLPDVDPNDGTRVRRTQIDTRSGAPVVVLAVENGGHYFHGDLTPELRRVFGRKSRDLEGPQVVWDWLSQFRR